MKKVLIEDFNTLTNPPANRLVSIVSFILSIAIPSLLMLYWFTLLPEGEKFVSHWDIQGKPDGWQFSSDSTTQITLFKIYFISIILTSSIIYLCSLFPALYNTYRSSLFNKFPKLKSLKIWYIKNISWLDIASILNLSIGFTFYVIVYSIVDANSTETKEISYNFTKIIIAILTLTVPFIILWEPHRKTK